MQVWIDHGQCVGHGVCAELVPELFALDDEGVARVCECGVMLRGRSRRARAVVPAGLEDAVLAAADECPAQCIVVEG
jgi:ferredoxin